MNAYVKISLRILVVINLILIVPSFVGIIAAFDLMNRSKILGVVSIFSIVLGNINAWYLICNFKSKVAWQYNLYLSLWAVLLWTIILVSYNNPFLVVYIWPLIMTICSWYVLGSLKQKQSVLS